MNPFTTLRSGRGTAAALLFALATLVLAPAPTYGQIYVSIPGSGEGTGILKDFTTGGSGTTLATGLNIPEGLALNGSDLYVALNRNNGSYATIAKYNLSGGGSTVFSTSTGSQSTMGLAFDSAGNLYAANTTTSSIVKFAPGNGTPTTLVANTGSGPYGLAVDSAANVYAALRNTNTIVSYNSSGALNWSTSLATGSSPVGLAINGTTLYVANHSANTIDMYSTVTGSSLGNFANSRDGLNGPFGLAFGGGTLFVANDGGVGSISLFTAAHTATSFNAGGFPAYIATSAIPEPSTYAAMAGAAMLGFAAWRRKRASA